MIAVVNEDEGQEAAFAEMLKVLGQPDLTRLALYPFLGLCREIVLEKVSAAEN